MSQNTTTDEDPFALGEFVEIEYTARAVDGGTVIDTTDPSVAAEAGLADVEASGPIVVVLGQGHVFEPVEDAITELEPGQQRTVTVKPADAFGEWDPAESHSVPTDALSGEQVGQNDRVTIDGRVGYVDAVENGTATVDFNHPLAGTTLEYDLRAIDRVSETSDRATALLGLYDLGDDITYTVTDGVLECSVTRPSVPDDAWFEQKRQFLMAATEQLAVEAIRFEERYRPT